MSEYSFGYDIDGNGPDLSETAPAGAEPKWFRDRMDKVSEQMNALTAENERLKAAQRRSTVAETLKAKGYTPAGAALYSGEPEKLDDWLKDHGEALAKLPSAPGEEQGGEEIPAGPPASTVSTEAQDQMQRLQEAGAGAAAPSEGSDTELANALKAAATPAEFDQIMKSKGSRYDWA